MSHEGGGEEAADLREGGAPEAGSAAKRRKTDDE
jgi:hypothetical protein